MPVAGVDTNYDDAIEEPWDVGNGSEELNGTFDIMGNAWEWMESPYQSGDYSLNHIRARRGGSGNVIELGLRSSYRSYTDPTYSDFEHNNVSFRVASVPEPCSLVLLFLGGLALHKRKRFKKRYFK